MYQSNIAENEFIDHAITEYKNLRLLAENIQDIVIIVDSTGRIKYVSPAYRNLIGIDPMNKIGRTLADSEYFHPDDYDGVVAVVQRGLADAKPDMVEFRYRNADGIYIWMEAASNPLFDENGSFLGAVCISRDISSRKAIEKALMESETKLKNQLDYLNTVINTMNEIFYTYDREGRLTLANRKSEELTGYIFQDCIGKRVVDFVPDSGKARVAEGIQTRLTMGINGHYEHPIIMKDGSERLLSVNVSPLIENGTINGGVVVADDITERRYAEKELMKQLNFMQKLMDSIPNPVYHKDREGLYQGCNEAFEAACGLTRDKIIGHTCDEVFPMDMNGYHHRMDEALFNKGGAQEYETCLSYADGLKHDVVLSRATYTNTDGSLGGMVGVILDITDRKQLEKQVMALERLNVMAEMAAGIAHEIRNPMTTARGFLQMMGHKPELKDYREYFELIIDELDRANGIITEFLSMGKNKAVNLKMQNLNDTVRMLYPLILADALNADKNVLIKLTDVPDVLMDQMDIRQLLLNLVRNGLEAMAPGGIINILTYTDNDEVVLSVQDQGKGIDPEVLDKLGTPFLTTKEQGTGLGLPVCYSIAARHNATVELETGLTGTNFMVRFKPAEYLDIK